MPEKFTSTVRIKLLYLAVEHFGIGAIVKLESFRLRRHPFTSVECLHFMCAASCLNVRWQCGHTPALILFVCFLSFAVAVLACFSAVWRCDVCHSSKRLASSNFACISSRIFSASVLPGYHCVCPLGQ